jgi:hypothetical protein
VIVKPVANSHRSRIVVIKRSGNFSQRRRVPGKHWSFKTLRVDHEIAHFDLTTTPKTKMKHDEDLPFKN